MEEPPSCWACKRRRVRCDFGRPSCSKCVAKGIACPGYSSTKPRRWKHYVSSPTNYDEKAWKTRSQKDWLGSTTQRSVVVYRQPQAPCQMLEGDVAPAATVLDALVYCLSYLFNVYQR
jgi:Zn(2)-Cys(6) binuclear cluster domain-containing protein